MADPVLDDVPADGCGVEASEALEGPGPADGRRAEGVQRAGELRVAGVADATRVDRAVLVLDRVAADGQGVEALRLGAGLCRGGVAPDLVLTEDLLVGDAVVVAPLLQFDVVEAAADRGEAFAPRVDALRGNLADGILDEVAPEVVLVADAAEVLVTRVFRRTGAGQDAAVAVGVLALRTFLSSRPRPLSASPAAKATPSTRQRSAGSTALASSGRTPWATP